MMLRSSERIEEIKNIAQKNLKKADNYPRDGSDLEFKEFWSLYRADVRELLGLISDLEGELENESEA